jgi:hypothetical protein
MKCDKKLISQKPLTIKRAVIIKKSNLWLTAPKRATPVN